MATKKHIHFSNPNCFDDQIKLASLFKLANAVGSQTMRKSRLGNYGYGMVTKDGEIDEDAKTIYEEITNAVINGEGTKVSQLSGPYQQNEDNIWETLKTNVTLPQHDDQTEAITQLLDKNGIQIKNITNDQKKEIAQIMLAFAHQFCKKDETVTGEDQFLYPVLSSKEVKGTGTIKWRDTPENLKENLGNVIGIVKEQDIDKLQFTMSDELPSVTSDDIENVANALYQIPRDNVFSGEDIQYRLVQGMAKGIFNLQNVPTLKQKNRNNIGKSHAVTSGSYAKPTSCKSAASAPPSCGASTAFHSDVGAQLLQSWAQLHIS
jgi:hypothetical protein